MLVICFFNMRAYSQDARCKSGPFQRPLQSCANLINGQITELGATEEDYESIIIAAEFEATQVRQRLSHYATLERRTFERK